MSEGLFFYINSVNLNSAKIILYLIKIVRLIYGRNKRKAAIYIIKDFG